jgi:hypothetical protein
LVRHHLFLFSACATPEPSAFADEPASQQTESLGEMPSLENPRFLMLGSVRAIILSLWFLESVFPLPQFSALTGAQTKMAKGLAICCGVLLTLAFLCPGALGDWIFSLKITRFVNGDGRLANGKPIETDFTFDVLSLALLIV